MNPSPGVETMFTPNKRSQGGIQEQVFLHQHLAADKDALLRPVLGLALQSTLLH